MTRRRVIVANARAGGWWWRAPILAILWLLIAIPLVVGLVVASKLRGWAKDLPDVPDLAAWQANAPQTSLVVAADGSHLAELPFRDGAVVGHRTLVPLDRMPRQLVLAILAAEDVHFLEHHGVDYPAILRAAWINYQVGRVVEGASTITQQVARNLLTCCRRRSATRAACSARCARRSSRARSSGGGPSARSSRPTSGSSTWGRARTACRPRRARTSIAT
ncbi:MAG: transglycosylase domain-containing protein [Proteobacteria bacterium]|nr:transglycosylase domain-containing protein [Pseudomonadota bacterium]